MPLGYGYGTEEQRVRAGATRPPLAIRDDLPSDPTSLAVSTLQRNAEARNADTARMSEENARAVASIGQNLGQGLQSGAEGYFKGRRAQQEYELGQQRGQLGAEELQQQQMATAKARGEAEFGAKDAASLGLQGAAGGETVSQYQARQHARGLGAEADSAISQAKHNQVAAEVAERTKEANIETSNLAPEEKREAIKAHRASQAASGAQTTAAQDEIKRGRRNDAIVATKQEMMGLADDPAKIKQYVDAKRTSGADMGVVYQAMTDVTDQKKMRDYWEMETDPYKRNEISTNIANINRAKVMKGKVARIEAINQRFQKSGGDFFETPQGMADREALAQEFDDMNPVTAGKIRDGFFWKTAQGSKKTASDAVAAIRDQTKREISRMLANNPGIENVRDMQDTAQGYGVDSNVYGGRTGTNAFKGPPGGGGGVQPVSAMGGGNQPWSMPGVAPRGQASPLPAPPPRASPLPPITPGGLPPTTQAQVPPQQPGGMPSMRNMARPTMNPGTGYVQGGTP